MTEQLRENYFLAIRMVVLLALEIYIVLILPLIWSLTIPVYQAY